jgi:hypothetical protein
MAAQRSTDPPTERDGRPSIATNVLGNLPGFSCALKVPNYNTKDWS